MCGVWCKLSLWLKFKWHVKWRIVEAWNVEPRTAPATLDSRFGGLLHLPHSPLLELHPLAAPSTSSDFASIPHIPFPHPSTLPPLQPPCLLHLASTPHVPPSHACSATSATFTPSAPSRSAATTACAGTCTSGGTWSWKWRSWACSPKKWMCGKPRR